MGVNNQIGMCFTKWDEVAQTNAGDCDCIDDNEYTCIVPIHLLAIRHAAGQSLSFSKPLAW